MALCSQACIDLSLITEWILFGTDAWYVMDLLNLSFFLSKVVFFSAMAFDFERESLCVLSSTASYWFRFLIDRSHPHSSGFWFPVCRLQTASHRSPLCYVTLISSRCFADCKQFGQRLGVGCPKSAL